MSEKLRDGRLNHQTKRLRDLFNDMDVVRARNGLANLVRGMLIEPAEKIDNTFADVSAPCSGMRHCYNVIYSWGPKVNRLT